MVLSGSRTVKCPFETWQIGEDTKPTYSCGTFGKVSTKLRWASGQHNPAKEWMWDDLNGSGRQLLFLLLAGQLHHLLHETHTVLCSYSTHCLGVGVPEWERRGIFKSLDGKNTVICRFGTKILSQNVYSLLQFLLGTPAPLSQHVLLPFQWWHTHL